MTELARAEIAEEGDVFSLRQRGREIAAAVGFDEQDQVRIGTALSEVSREVLDLGGGGEAVFSLDPVGAALTVSVTCRRLLPAAVPGNVATGLSGAARLLEVLREDGSVTAINMTKSLPAHVAVDPRRLAMLRGRLASFTRASPLDELRAQNQQLLATLDQLNRRQDELVRLNEELEETNRGVMAMYGQLSEELEETNRGVVALYAELDERTLQLQHANQSKSRFLSNVSHELRSPINSVLALAGLLLDQDGEPLTADQRHQIGLVRSSSSELLGLVNSLLDLAKAESGRLQPQIAPCDLREVLADIRGTFRPLVGPATCLEISEPDVPQLATDRTLLAQVLRNLLSNAVKFTERGVISVDAALAGTVQGQYVEFVVRDTGIGISRADQHRVFNEFFQVRGPLQSRHRGSGLGLPYVKQVLDVLGGGIELESELGRGTTVTVRLPVQPPATSSPSRSSVSPQPAPGPAPAAVRAMLRSALIVDDDPVFRRRLRSKLEGRARLVMEADSAEAGLAIAATSSIDVMFLDLRLPDGDGTDVLAKMNQDPGLRAIPVVIVTSTDLDAVEGPSLLRRATIAKSELDQGCVDTVLSRLEGHQEHE